MNCWPKGAAHAGRTRLLKGYLSNYRARDVNLRARNDLWPGSRDACQLEAISKLRKTQRAHRPRKANTDFLFTCRDSRSPDVEKKKKKKKGKCCFELLTFVSAWFSIASGLPAQLLF